jgi:hypothetical protein
MAMAQTHRIRVLTEDEYIEGLRAGYRSRTLTARTGGRVVYLPGFPTVTSTSKDDLLLVNVAGQCSPLALVSSSSRLESFISHDEIELRREGASTRHALQLMLDYDHQRTYAVSLLECRA